MYITSRQNDEVLQAKYTVTDDINGVPTLETDYLQLQKYHETPIKMMSQAFIDKYVLVLRDETAVGDDSLLRLTGVHQFIHDMNMSRVYEEYTQYFSIENILDVVFAGSNYTYEVKGDKTYYSLMFENFGDKDKMSLIQQICGRWEVEYHIEGTHITFGDRRGVETAEVFRYKMNILDANVNLDISEAATYILGKFGKKAEEEGDIDTYVEKELLHPLAEHYGRLDATPYSNENITVEATMDDYLKRKIEETWILSIELDVTDLIGKGKVNVGDTVWAIDERMDVEIQTRIIKIVRYYDINDRVYKTKVTLGNYNYIDSVSNTEQEAETIPERIDRTNRRLQELHAQWENDFNQNRDNLIGRIEDGFEQQKQEIDADLDAWKRVEEDIRKGISDSVDNVIGNMESMETAVGEWQDTAGSRFNTIENNLTNKLEEIDLLPLESLLFNQIDVTAENMDLVFGRLGDHETDLANFRLTADGLSSNVGTLRTDLDAMEEWSLVAGSNLEQTKAGFDAYVIANNDTVGGIKTDVSNLVLRADTFSSNISTIRGDLDDVESWRADKGALFEQTALGFEQRVWLGDAGGKNLLTKSDLPKDIAYWAPRGTNVGRYTPTSRGFTEYLWVNVAMATSGQSISVLSPLLSEDVVEGETYSIQFKTRLRNNVQENFDYMYLMNEEGSVNQGLNSYTQKIVEVDSGTSANLHIIEFQANFSGKARVLFGTRADRDGVNSRFYITEPKIEKGRATAYAPSTEDFMQYTDFVLRSDGFFLGGKYVGGEHYSTAIVGDATGLKLIGDNIDIDGNLNVLGKIRAESLSSVYANISEVRTRLLTANSVKTDMLQVNEAMIREFFATTGRIRELTSRSAFINEIQAINITAEQIRLGFNNIGNNVKISSGSLDTLSNGTLTSRMNATGHHFYKDGTYAGFIGVIPRTTQPNKIGLSFNMTNRNDFMAWTHDDNNDNTYTTKLVWAKDNSIDFTAKGFNFYDDVRMMEKLTVNAPIESTSTVQAGSRAKMQSSANGARLYASDNIWLYVNENGQVGVSINGNAQAIYNP